MTRREKIIVAYLVAISIGVMVMLAILLLTKPSKKEVDEPLEAQNVEGLIIDRHAVEVVYDQYDAAYLKYVIGPMKIIYIPLPPEAEVEDYSDSLHFYYTKTENNGKENKRKDNKRTFD